MTKVTRAQALEYCFALAIFFYGVAYKFSAGSAAYMALTLILCLFFSTLLWLVVSISIGKFLVSWLIVLARTALRLPFRAIRAAPRAIRTIFFDGPVVVTFFIWFRVLVFLDRHILRRVVLWSGGLRHPSGIRISAVNAISPSFSPINGLNKNDTAEFDLRSALSLSNLAKLAYEDEGVVKYELKEAGFNLDFFRVIHYNNTSGFVALYEQVVVIAFRGTEPLNLMHIMTDLQGGLVELSHLDHNESTNAGRAHYGFLEALRLHRTDAPKAEVRSRPRKQAHTIALDENNSIASTFAALFKIGGFLFRSFAKQPLTINFPLTKGKITAFQQVQEALEHIRQHTKVSQIQLTGHSLGGALATVFFAQAQLSSLPGSIVKKMSVYSFGAPRLGDQAFTDWMNRTGKAKKIYKIVNAQDLVPRLPALPSTLPKPLRKLPYAESPGTAVHLHPLAEESPTLEEYPGLYIHRDGKVPGIEFWGLSGLLSTQTIKQVRTERWLWIFARLAIPFVMFDHLASQYTLVLEELYAKSEDNLFEVQVHAD